MKSAAPAPAKLTVQDVYAEAKGSAIPIHLAGDDGSALARGLSAPQRRWLEVARFDGGAMKTVLIPGEKGDVEAIAFGIGKVASGEPCGPPELLAGQLAASLPPATYRLADDTDNAEAATIAWGLGAYRFRRYRQGTGDAPPRLVIPEAVDRAHVVNTVEAVWLGRDLINTPASDMGPAELEAAARDLAKRHGATATSTVGDVLLEKNFPMIHAVGRAHPRAPRLIEINWKKKGGRKDAPSVVLVGKGITFDTGGLDVKPASAMLLMKKDMGGAATALALGHMIMGQKLDVRLRILIPSAENSIGGDAFRPGDVLTSRSGRTVEIGNTDAEGRLVLADALSLADDEAPDQILVFATLTGAARTALGPDLPAFFTDDDDYANALVAQSQAIGDPVWRLPLWPGYNRHLDSDIADMNNVWESPFAGAITAALFLRRFVSKAKRFAHFDLYGWRPQPRPLGPKGGEPQTARAVFAQLKAEIAG